MIRKLVLPTYIFMLMTCMTVQPGWAQRPSSERFYLIAHRGGVVDSATAENSMASLKKAYARGYRMVEIDMRTTKDGVLITNHDASLKRYYGVNRPVSDMAWNEVASLRGSNGNHILKLEQVFAYCSGKMQVMIDNKLKGNDTVLFNKLLAMLRRYKLDKEALMIGTDESTEFFTGKIKLSCTRQQLQDNMKRADYHPGNYYLFGSDITREDVQWAREHHILPVAVVNAWTFTGDNRMEQARQAAEKMIATGADHFQIDTEFEAFFKQVAGEKLK